MQSLSGIEILTISAIIGGITGYFIRNKKITQPVLGIILGVVGSIVMSILLVSLVFQSLVAIPIYSIFGAWLFNFIWAKIKG